MMIIGIELLVPILGGLTLILVIISSIIELKNTANRKNLHYCSSKISSILLALGIVFFVSSFTLSVCIQSSQKDVENHYIQYLELKNALNNYDKLDPLEQNNLTLDIITYNLWHNANKEDLNNVWTLKGCSEYAKLFDIIEMKLD